MAGFRVTSRGLTEDRPDLAVAAGASRYLTPSGGDDSAGMVSALTSFAPYVSPVVVLGPGTFHWNAQVPTFLRSTPAVVRGAGVLETIIQLSAGAPRAFDFGKVADYDTFTNIKISRLTVDRNSVAGQHHTVIGIWQAGAWQSRLNLSKIVVEDVEIINAPQGQVGSLIIGVGLNASNAPGDTLITVTDCAARRIRSTGCDQLVSVHGAPSGANVTANTYHDRIEIDEITHTLPTTPTAFFAQAHVMAGTKGQGGTIRIDRVTGYNSSDVGIECDGFSDAQINGFHVEDAYDYAVYAVNYAAPEDVEIQQLTLAGTVRYKSVLHGQGIKVGDVNNASATIRPPSVHLDVTYQRTTPGASTSISNGLGEALDVYGSRRVTGEVRSIIEIGSYNSASNYTPSAVYLHAPDTTVRSHVDLRIKSRATGTVASTGLINWRSLVLRDGLFSDFDIDVDSDLALTSGGNAAVIHADMGSVAGGAGACQMSGRLRVAVPTGGGGGNTPTGIQFESGSFNAVVSNAEVTVHHSDMSGLASTATNVNFAGASTLAGGVRFVNNKWRLGHQSRRPIAATGTTNLDTLYDYIGVTATGASKTLPLPVSAPPGRTVVVGDEGGDAATNNVIVTIQSAGTFADGTSSKTVTTNYGTQAFRYSGTKWQPVTV